MSNQKFFRFPFASAGDKTDIPDPAQGDGSLSYNQGFGPDYERVPGVDPLAKRVPRDGTNQYLFDITDNLRQYQLTGTPEWVLASQNNGVSVPYEYGAQVRYNAGSGTRVWFSLVDNNTATPGSDATKWTEDTPFIAAIATNAEVQAGTEAAKLVTPLNLSSRTATTARTGLAALATSAEVIAGTEATKIVTPATLNTRTALETRTGLVQLASTAEAAAKVDTTKAVTPAGLGAAFATLDNMPVFPEVLNVSGVIPLSSPANGTIRIAAGTDFVRRGYAKYTTAQTDLSTAASKTYHVRWTASGGFVIKDLADVAYNPTALPETDPTFDSTYDDMLVARVVTSAGNVATITGLSNKNRLAVSSPAAGTVVANSGTNGARFAFSSPINWARTPKTKSLTEIAIGTSGSSPDRDVNTYAPASPTTSTIIPATRYSSIFERTQDYAVVYSVQLDFTA